MMERRLIAARQPPYTLPSGRRRRRGGDGRDDGGGGGAHSPAVPRRGSRVGRDLGGNPALKIFTLFK